MSIRIATVEVEAIHSVVAVKKTSSVPLEVLLSPYQLRYHARPVSRSAYLDRWGSGVLRGKIWYGSVLCVSPCTSHLGSCDVFGGSSCVSLSCVGTTSPRRIASFASRRQIYTQHASSRPASRALCAPQRPGLAAGAFIRRLREFQ